MSPDTAQAPLVSVVIPVRDRFDLTRQCLATLARHGAGAPLEVVLVDDGSTDATTTEAAPLGQALFGPAFRLLRPAPGRGFAAAVNSGAREARGRFLFLLNNDTELLGPVFPLLLDLLDSDPGLGAVGPLLLYPGPPDARRVQHLGIATAHGVKTAHLFHLFPAGHPVVFRRRRLRAITMAALFIERDLFWSLDGLFEGYKNGLEDLDFCARLAAAGRCMAVCPEARLIHLCGQTPGRHDHEDANSRLLARRVGDVLVPDLSQQARQDGYRMALTPWLDPYLVPGPERLAAIEADYAADPDPIRLPELLDREPAWSRGYELLAAHGRARGDAGAERAARVRQSAFLPLPEVLSAVAEAAERAGDADRLAALARRQADIRRLMAQPEALTLQARAALKKARAAGDTDLAAIMTDWLRHNAAMARPRP